MITVQHTCHVIYAQTQNAKNLTSQNAGHSIDGEITNRLGKNMKGSGPQYSLISIVNKHNSHRLK